MFHNLNGSIDEAVVGNCVAVFRRTCWRATFDIVEVLAIFVDKTDKASVTIIGAVDDVASATLANRVDKSENFDDCAFFHRGKVDLVDGAFVAIMIHQVVGKGRADRHRADDQQSKQHLYFFVHLRYTSFR